MARELFLMVMMMAPGAAAGEPGFMLGGNAARGRTPYRQLCAPCHGDRGLGNGPAAVGLDPRPGSVADPAAASRLTPKYVYEITRDGGPAHGKAPAMIGFGKAISDQQLRDVSAYLLSLVPPRR